MPVSRFSCVLFDCDGVLVNSEPITNSILREMLQEIGWDISVEECIRRFVGRAFKDEWKGDLRTHGGPHRRRLGPGVPSTQGRGAA